MNRLLVVCLILMLAACRGTAPQAGTPVATADVAGLNGGRFKATVSGSVSSELSGTGGAFKQEGGGLLISLVADDDPRGSTITLLLPAGTVAGTYTPKSYADVYDSASNKITDIGASFSVLTNTNGVDAYAFVSEGTVTLQTVDPVTGTLHFKAKLESGGEVDVTATFYQLSVV